MLRRPHYIALGLVVMLTLIILNLPAKRPPPETGHRGPVPAAVWAGQFRPAIGGHRGAPSSRGANCSGRTRSCGAKTSSCGCRSCRRRRPPGKTPGCANSWAGSVRRPGNSSWPGSSCASRPIGGHRADRPRQPGRPAGQSPGADHRRPGRAHFLCQPYPLAGGACWATPIARSRRGSKTRRATPASSAPRAVGDRLRRNGLSFRNANLKPGKMWSPAVWAGSFPRAFRSERSLTRTRSTTALDSSAGQTGGKSERAGGSVGDVPMNWLNTFLSWARPSWRCFGRRRSAACATCWGRRLICCRR